MQKILYDEWVDEITHDLIRNNEKIINKVSLIFFAQNGITATGQLAPKRYWFFFFFISIKNKC